MDTRVVDKLLNFLESRQCYIFGTLSPLQDKMNPYYGKYVENHKVDEGIELIFLPLCDNTHFYGFIINLAERNIIFVDSLRQIKSGKRSIVNILKEVYFGGSKSVRISSYFKNRAQNDSHSCGAWLIAGFVAYRIGLQDESVLNREKVIDLLMILNENISKYMKREKSFTASMKDL